MSADRSTETRPVDEIIVDMMKDPDTQSYVIKGWASVYAEGATVPPESIDPLVEAFEGARVRFNGVESEIAIIDAAITAIEDQKKDDTGEADEQSSYLNPPPSKPLTSEEFRELIEWQELQRKVGRVFNEREIITDEELDRVSGTWTLFNRVMFDRLISTISALSIELETSRGQG